MDSIKAAMDGLDRRSIVKGESTYITFEHYLKKLIEKPEITLRNIFQVFHDMVISHIGEGIDEYPGDPESIKYLKFNCYSLFAYETDRPFFADRIFANRFVNLVKALKRGAQQNKVYIFRGPPGCGKSTFLNNLLLKFEEYANTEDGMRYETIWRFDRRMLSNMPEDETVTLFNKLVQLLESKPQKVKQNLHVDDNLGQFKFHDYFDIPCPSHDNPVLLIPKKHRKSFLKNLYTDNNDFKKDLFSKKEYEWVFRDNPCTICSSLYKVLIEKFGDLEKVFEMIHARPYQFDRRNGQGITVFNPGDELQPNKTQTDAIIQRNINRLFNDSNKVKYIYSQYVKTNNGVYSLMDIKSHNTKRLIELHNIISEGLHKVEDIEETVHSLLLAVMNPEDQKNIEEYKSFLDRIVYINIPYVLDVNTEVEIYKNVFGTNIEARFLPRVLKNFARVIVSTRVTTKPKALLKFIEKPEKYDLYCDKNLILLKMEIYSGNIPDWVSEGDRKRFTAKLRREIIGESEMEGETGISGRDSINLFNEFYSRFGKRANLINMSELINFFLKAPDNIKKLVQKDFLDSLVRMYDYTILNEVKESLYYYNKQQISKEIQNYLFAINFEIGTTGKCIYTGDKIEVTEDYLTNFEKGILGTKATKEQCRKFRADRQKEYTTSTLTQEIMVKGKNITKTKIYESLHDRYSYNLKQKVLEPFLENENFRRAIKDYDTTDFKTYEKKIRMDVRYLLRNLARKYGYTEQSAKEMCIYVIDKELAKKFESV